MFVDWRLRTTETYLKVRLSFGLFGVLEKGTSGSEGCAHFESLGFCPERKVRLSPS